MIHSCENGLRYPFGRDSLKAIAEIVGQIHQRNSFATLCLHRRIQGPEARWTLSMARSVEWLDPGSQYVV
jgi:hypothetical protein